MSTLQKYKKIKKSNQVDELLLIITNMVFSKKPFLLDKSEGKSIDFHLEMINRIDELLENYEINNVSRESNSESKLDFSIDNLSAEIRPPLSKKINMSELEIENNNSDNFQNSKEIIFEELKPEHSSNIQNPRLISEFDYSDGHSNMNENFGKQIEIIEIGSFLKDDISPKTNIKWGEKDKNEPNKKVEIIETKEYNDNKNKKLSIFNFKPSRKSDDKTQVYYKNKILKQDDRGFKNKNLEYTSLSINIDKKIKDLKEREVELKRKKKEIIEQEKDKEKLKKIKSKINRSESKNVIEKNLKKFEKEEREKKRREEKLNRLKIKKSALEKRQRDREARRAIKEAEKELKKKAREEKLLKRIEEKKAKKNSIEKEKVEKKSVEKPTKSEMENKGKKVAEKASKKASKNQLNKKKYSKDSKKKSLFDFYRKEKKKEHKKKLHFDVKKKNEIDKNQILYRDINNIISAPVEKSEPSLIDEDVKKLLVITDNLLGELPEEVIDKFANSDDFKLYSKVLQKYKIK